ncbi:MAG TPA: ABC transporter permease [Terriglobia bacterium]|nr:ABC transporter permease [Terriglobia bacterium]
MARWDFLSRRRKREVQLDPELAFHIDELKDAHIAAGMSPEEAHRQAMLAFGGREQIKEELRDVYRVAAIETTLANLRSALRFMRKSPMFSLTVILTLALGIGANSAVFSAIDAILLKPLPFPDGDQLMKLDQINPKLKNPETAVAPVRLEDWNRMNSVFQAIAGYYTQDSSETSGSLPEKVTEGLVTPRFFEMWGIGPELGRDFTPEESRFGGPSAVLLSDLYWRRRFGADPHVLGKKLWFGKDSATIVGVLPASLRFTGIEADIWSPVPMDAPYAQSRASTWFNALGRLEPGVTVEQAQANMETVQAQLAKQFPKTDEQIAVRISPYKETMVGGVRESLWILFGSVTLLLLIACTNIAALLLARATQRQHEIAIRFSLGATRPILVAQLLTEALVLAVFGAALGLLVAGAASKVFRSLAADLPRLAEVHLDFRIVLYSLACALAATLLSALLPALRATRHNLSGSLAQAGRTQVSARNPLQWLLVGIQVMLAVTLLAGAGLLLRSFQELGRVSPGFETAHVLTLHISAGWGETGDMKGLTQRIYKDLDYLDAVPGVEAAATSANLPGVPTQLQTELKLSEGQADLEHPIVAESRFVSPSYFATMRIPLLAGELCPKNSGEPGPVCVLVNRSFAAAYLPSSPVMGHQLLAPPHSFLPTGNIHGMVADAREQGINHAPGPVVYWCFSAPMPDPYFLIRTRTEPVTMAETVRRKLHEIEPARSVFDIMPLEQHLGDAFAETRLRTVLLTFFALTAISLACIGLYGTLSYFVSVRRREVGLRLALGAMPGQIVRQFFLQGVRVSLLGCLAGLVLSAGFGRLLVGMLYGVSPLDAVTFSGVVLIVLGVAAIASLLPAFRAARVEPMQVLREE